MEEKIFTKVSIPLFEDKELEMFDNNIHNIIEEYSKMDFKEKDQILTQRVIIKQEEEINDLQQEIQDLKEEQRGYQISYESNRLFIIELEDRINKAIEYIEPKMINEYLHTDYINKMLEILRGEDNE